MVERNTNVCNDCVHQETMRWTVDICRCIHLYMVAIRNRTVCIRDRTPSRIPQAAQAEKGKLHDAKGRVCCDAVSVWFLVEVRVAESVATSASGRCCSRCLGARTTEKQTKRPRREQDEHNEYIYIYGTRRACCSMERSNAYTFVCVQHTTAYLCCVCCCCLSGCAN